MLERKANFSQFWVSKDIKEQVVVINGSYHFIGNGSIDILGTTLEEAKERLKRLGRKDVLSWLP